jgi:hypothetical protein
MNSKLTSTLAVFAAFVSITLSGCGVGVDGATQDEAANASKVSSEAADTASQSSALRPPRCYSGTVCQASGVWYSATNGPSLCLANCPVPSSCVRDVFCPFEGSYN